MSGHPREQIRRPACSGDGRSGAQPLAGPQGEPNLPPADRRGGVGPRRGAPRRWPLWHAVVVLLLAAGCAGPGGGPASGSDHAKAKVARTHIERGPVRVTVEVKPHPARLSDEPTLTLTLDYQQGVHVEKPPFGEAFGDFIIRDFRQPLPQVRGDREIVRQIYTLEPTRTGTLQIDPIAVSFTDARPQGDGKRHTIQTEALPIQVESMVKGKGAPSLDDLQGMAGPVPLPPPSGLGWGWWAAVGLFLVAGGAAAVLGARRRKKAVEKQLSPQEMAYLELQQLVRENLGQTDVKLFYVRLTGIVRRYIERTTDIHAPEQTTEEFLREIGAGDVFARDEQQRLRSFLESADLVKFAAHEPAPDDIEQTFQRAKVFLGLEPQEVAA